MKIGIIADTHDHLDKIAKAVDIFNREACHIVLHAGDFVAPFAVKALHGLHCRMVAVFGNNDGEKEGLEKSFREEDEIHFGPHPFKLDGKTFLLMHEAPNAKTFDLSAPSDYLVYGHLHEKDHRKGSPVIINPGECCGWVNGKASVAILDLSSNHLIFIDL